MFEFTFLFKGARSFFNLVIGAACLGFESHDLVQGVAHITNRIAKTL